MFALRQFLPLLVGAALLAGCAYDEAIVPPTYADFARYSLCDYDRPLSIKNVGMYDSSTGTGELLLAGQLSQQPVENLLTYSAVRLVYEPDVGLRVTLINPQGVEVSELIAAKWLRCDSEAMVLELPSDAFYLWASVGVKSRRLRLQVAQDHGLILHSLWEEKGMGAVIIPLKFTGDSWAIFSPDDGEVGEPKPLVAVESIGACSVLTGRYAALGTSVRLDGSFEFRNAREQFFRREITGEPVPQDAPDIAALDIAHTADAAIDLTLQLEDNTTKVRQLEAKRVSCVGGRWIAKGKKDSMSPLMLLMGSAGVWWEDLVLWRDGEGALLVRGTYRSRGALFLIPTGSTSELFMRFELAPAEPTEPTAGPPPDAGT